MISEDGDHDHAHAVVDLVPGTPVVLELHLGPEGYAAPVPETVRRSGTQRAWSQWVSSLNCPPGPVLRSALTLKSLCHEPTGATMAAATTSLPEVSGGVRNWDYRFCWPRDSAVSCAALLALGSTVEAGAFLDWLAGRVGAPGEMRGLRPVYPLHGDEFLPEAVLPDLNGYRGSRPVRIGNQAEHQRQMDMFGPILDLMAQFCARDRSAVDRYWPLVSGLADFVVGSWTEPDHGIWEERRAARHRVHSKVMCWLALERAATIAEAGGRVVPEGWVAAKHAIHADVLERGWNDRVSSFTAVYGGDEMEAGVLHVVLSGFLPPSDARVAGTVAAVERTLRDGAIVYRYRYDDGLPGREGGFLLCTTWLIEALALVGRLDDARVLYDRYVGLAGPTGLFAEQHDPEREIALGNVPQAYSHAGLIRAAKALGLV
jgi:GH15 family glucan-1,4-alpha-glucosidase